MTWGDPPPPTPREKLGQLYRELRSLASELNRDRLLLRNAVGTWIHFHSRDLRRKADNVWHGAMLAVALKELDIERGKVRKAEREIEVLRQRPAVTVNMPAPVPNSPRAVHIVDYTPEYLREVAAKRKESEAATGDGIVGNMPCPHPESARSGNYCARCGVLVGASA